MTASLVRDSEKRSGSARIRTSRGRLTYEEDWEFLVKSDSRFEDRNVVLGTVGLPIPLVSIRGSMVCRSLDVKRREEQPMLWDCAASYSSEVEENQGGSQGGDPTTWVVVRETKFETLTEIAYRDRLNVPIVNTAKAPFETLPMFKRLIPVWEFWQFESLAVTDEILADRNETYNENDYKQKAAFTLLCNVGSSSVGFYYGFRRRLTQYTLKYNWKTWKLRIPSVGTHELIAGVLTPIYKGGELTLKGLKEDGTKVGDTETPFLMSFDEYQPSDFSFLRI